MKISTKGRYALRMMLDFALHPGECTKIKDAVSYTHLDVYKRQAWAWGTMRIQEARIKSRIINRIKSSIIAKIPPISVLILIL